MPEVRTPRAAESSTAAIKGLEPPIAPLSPGPRKENTKLYQLAKADIEAFVKDPNSSTLLLIAGTGTGKTFAGTQIALGALGPNGHMAVTENLRKATEESPVTIVKDRNRTYPDEKVGDVIGFQNKYHREVTKTTRMLFCPIQSLLNKAKNSPDGLLLDFDIVFVDEVHKESKSNELLLATLLDLQEKRAKIGKPLKVILTSATMDADKLGDYFKGVEKDKLGTYLKGVKKVEVPGVNFDIETKYHDKEVPIKELPRAAAEKVKWAIDKGDEGNILVFFSGVHQIEDAQKALAEMKLGDNVEVRPYYGSMSKEEQNEITKKIEGNKKRIVFLATNAAQESLTWPIKIVVDTCTHKHQKLDSITGRSYLEEEKAPLDHLMQRKGRVGRNDPKGSQIDKYYPLTTKSDWEGRATHEKAEITRTDLTREVLTLLANGYDPNPKSTKENVFRYLNKPDQGHLNIAFKRLEKLGAVDEARNLTEKGRFMASLQLGMNNASLVADGIKYGAAEKGLAERTTALAAMLEEYPNVFENANDALTSLRGDAKSDLLPLVNVLMKYAGTLEGDRVQLALSLGLRPDMMRDAYDLYKQLMTDSEAAPNLSSGIKNIGQSGLDLAIHDSFADAQVSGSTKNTLWIEGVGGASSIRIDKNSVFSKDKDVPYFAKDGDIPRFVSTNIRMMNEGGREKRIAGLNHVISEEALGILKEKKPPEAVQQPVAVVDKPVEAEKALAASSVEKPAEELKTETLSPPQPPPKYKWWQRVRNWFRNIFR